MQVRFYDSPRIILSQSSVFYNGKKYPPSSLLGFFYYNFYLFLVMENGQEKSFLIGHLIKPLNAKGTYTYMYVLHR